MPVVDKHIADTSIEVLVASLWVALSGFYERSITKRRLLHPMEERLPNISQVVIGFVDKLPAYFSIFQIVSNGRNVDVRLTA